MVFKEQEAWSEPGPVCETGCPILTQYCLRVCVRSFHMYAPGLFPDSFKVSSIFPHVCEHYVPPAFTDHTGLLLLTPAHKYCRLPPPTVCLCSIYRFEGFFFSSFLYAVCFRLQCTCSFPPV